MVPDAERLLAPVSDDNRAGADLAYDLGRHEIEQAFEASVSIDANGDGQAGGDIDWRRIVAIIVEQSAGTKDLWLAIYLCRAGARSGSLDLVETGLRYLAGLIELYWEDGHPRLEEYGVEGRTGACQTLASFGAFIGPLRAGVLLDHPRHGTFTGEDLQRFQRGGESEANYGSFRATIEDPVGMDRLIQAAERLEAIAALFHRVDGALTQRVGEGVGVSFEPIYQALAELLAAVRNFLPQRRDAQEEVHGTPGEDEAGGTRAGAGPTAVRSRDDVLRVIDLVVDYYRRSEPQSPVPLLLTRAREWVNRDFMEVLADIAPNAVGDARQLLQFRGGS